ncbi:alpha-beta hydrolase superfamily lysophospholipase [Sphingomonas sp. BE123]|uniref:serine aminopeptidase domain-containing protein n=1 Tax=Sphingomonas sp. BE123 TaxID=2817842 RepID=UPI00285C5499|nr:alpha/beta hydrolase [Sphingomonas sp. BE123]MDR6852550.1 alpha-beta hydrolase superfamily lysophospholipase [Sphingomonas sp. BE123]
MGAQVIARRALLGGAVALGGLGLAPAAVLARSGTAREETLRVSATRTTQMWVWQAAQPRGIAVFSHGHGGAPLRYGLIVEQLVRDGWTVAAPLHVDSLSHPDRAKFSAQAGFPERINDLNAAIALLQARMPDLPVICAGHSFGTLSALCLGGGLAYFSRFRNPAVRAVVGFSSPGKVAGLVRPTAFASVDLPVLMISGTADTVPGFVTDPADHLFVSETVAGPSYAYVVKDGGHNLIVETAALQRVKPALDAFLAGHGRGDAGARRALAALKPSTGDRFLVKNA